MATYEIDTYGTEKYGHRPLTELDSFPVLATPTGQDSVLVTWAVPGGTWTRLRLVKSSAGYPVTQEDGQVLYDSTYPDGSYTDTQLAPGRWYYYSVFILVGSTWRLAGRTSCLAVGNRGSAAWLDLLVPNHFKFNGDELSSLTSSQPNTDLADFLSIFAWQWDVQRTYGDTLLDLYDPHTTHEVNVGHLSSQFGMPAQRTMPAKYRRQAAENATYLHQQHGTVQGLKNLIQVTTGLDTDIRIGPNMMISDDNGEFRHPLSADWSATLRYHQFDVVLYNKRVYECRVTGTTGDAQKPSGTATQNTWWTWIDRRFNETWGKNAATDGQYAWMCVDIGLPAQPMVSNGYLAIGQGVPKVADLGDLTNNALAVKNIAGGTKTLDIRSTSRLKGFELINSVEQMQNVRDGIPLPKVEKTWDVATTFLPGDLVRYNGLVFQCAFKVVGGTPPGILDPVHITAWRNVGVDERYGITVSVYCHNGFGAGDPTCQIYPHMQFFDEHGKYFTTLYAKGLDTLAIDTFGFPGKVYPDPTNPDINGRQMERFPLYTWTTRTGALIRDAYLGGTIRPTNPFVSSIATITATADTQLGLTFRTPETGGKSSALVFRYVDNSNMWQARRGSLVKVVAGVGTTMGTYTTATDDDRLVVKLAGNVITIYRNSVQVLQVTDAFSATATKHGVGYI